MGAHWPRSCGRATAAAPPPRLPAEGVPRSTLGPHCLRPRPERGRRQEPARHWQPSAALSTACRSKGPSQRPPVGGPAGGAGWALPARPLPRACPWEAPAERRAAPDGIPGAVPGRPLCHAQLTPSALRNLGSSTAALWPLKGISFFPRYRSEGTNSLPFLPPFPVLLWVLSRQGDSLLAHSAILCCRQGHRSFSTPWAPQTPFQAPPAESHQCRSLLRWFLPHRSSPQNTSTSLSSSQATAQRPSTGTALGTHRGTGHKFSLTVSSFSTAPQTGAPVPQLLFYTFIFSVFTELFFPKPVFGTASGPEVVLLCQKQQCLVSAPPPPLCPAPGKH